MINCYRCADYQCHKRILFFMNYSILSSSCCFCTNIYYILILIGSCPCVLCLASLTCSGRRFKLFGCKLPEDGEQPKHIAAR